MEIKNLIKDLENWIDRKPTISLLAGIVLLLLVNKLSSIFLTAVLIVFIFLFVMRKIKKAR